MPVQNGNTVAVHYRGTLENGQQFDSSHDRGEPLVYQAGMGQMIPGFDSAVMGMEAGDTKTFTVTPDQAYGPHQQEAIQVLNRKMFGEGAQLIEGQVVQGTNQQGQTAMATIITISDDNIVVDLNHPLAGKNLNFEVEVVSIT